MSNPFKSMLMLASIVTLLLVVIYKDEMEETYS
jgi:hypothetical protein